MMSSISSDNGYFTWYWVLNMLFGILRDIGYFITDWIVYLHEPTWTLALQHSIHFHQLKTWRGTWWTAAFGAVVLRYVPSWNVYAYANSMLTFLHIPIPNCIIYEVCANKTESWSYNHLEFRTHTVVSTRLRWCRQLQSVVCCSDRNGGASYTALKYVHVNLNITYDCKMIWYLLADIVRHAHVSAAYFQTV